VGKLLFTGNDVGLVKFSSTSFSEALDQMFDKPGPIGLDTETNVVKSIVDRELKVIAITSYDEKLSWVIEYEELDGSYIGKLRDYLRSRLCIIHNVVFDYTILKKYDILLENVWCTMLSEQVLNNGFSAESGYHGLKATYLRRFEFDISKAEQLTFGDGLMTDDKVIYAATDTVKLPSLYRTQKAEMLAIDKSINQRGNRGLYKTIWWENEFAKVVGDMEFEGVIFDRDKWYTIEDSIRPDMESTIDEMNQLLVDDFEEFITDKGKYSARDTQIKTIGTSSAIKKKIISRFLLQEVSSTSVKGLRELLKELDTDFPVDLGITNSQFLSSEYAFTQSSDAIFNIIKAWAISTADTKDMIESAVYNQLMQMDRDFMVELGIVRPGGEVLFNWGSPAQKLELLQLIDPRIPNTKADTLLDHLDKHPIIQKMIDVADYTYQINNFGRSFYDKHVCPDGKFRTRFNQILKTGRLSSVQPNLLNIPRKGDAHRKALVPEEGTVIINADFDGQELEIVTKLASVKSWQEYKRQGYDLHSMNASMIFGKDWEDAREPGCKFYENEAHKKCKCKGHQLMRDKSKTTTFGVLYGIGPPGLAAQLKSSIEEAQFILDKFFEVVPEVRVMMNKFGTYALTNGHIIEPVLGRIRYFDQWKLHDSKEAAGVERAAFNSPIQSAGSSILKIAFVLMRRNIKHEKLEKLLKLLLPYHDETLAQSKNDEETIKKSEQIVEKNMQLAARLAGFAIDAGAEHGNSWYDAH